MIIFRFFNTSIWFFIFKSGVNTNLKLGFCFLKSSKKSKNFDSFKVYVIRCWNEEEEFYKIGRTFRTVKHRFRDKIGKYNYEVIKVEIGEAEDIYKLEKTSIIKLLW